MRRYPFANLCEALHVTPTDLKRRLGLDHRQLSRYLEQGLPEARADELACRLGLVTVNVWPEMIEHAIEDTSVECAADDCCERFVPRDKANIWCSRRCYQRVKMRRYRATEAGRENNRKWRKAWYAECAEYDIAQSRRRRQRQAAA